MLEGGPNLVKSISRYTKSIVKYFYELILCEFTDIDCWVGGGSILSFLDKREMYDIEIEKTAVDLAI